MTGLVVFYSFFTLIIVNTVWFAFSEKSTELGVTVHEIEEEGSEKKKKLVSCYVHNKIDWTWYLIDFAHSLKKKYPEDLVSLPSRLTFWWLSG